MIDRYGGCIAVVTHLGNWDAAGAWVGSLGYRLVSVAEVLRPRRMFEFFLEHRARLGMVIYPAEKGVTEKLVDEVLSMPAEAKKSLSFLVRKKGG